MAGIVSRWAWLDEARPIADEDRDADGTPAVAALEAWASAMVDARLAEMTAIRAALLTSRAALRLAVRVDDAGGLGLAVAADLLATPTEVLPSSVVVALRFRASDGTGDAVDGRVVARLVAGHPEVALPIDRILRDELIALAHAAPHWG